PAQPVGAGLVPAGRPDAADPDAGARADRVVADGTLPRPEGPAGEPAHVLVLRHADHLPDVDGARDRQDAARPEPFHAPGDLVPGNPVLRGPVRPLEVAPRAA